jgi:hypothetical protein
MICLRQILLTESIGKGFSDETLNSYKLVEESVLSSLAMNEKGQEVANHVLQRMIRSCRYVIENTLAREEQGYPSPYITVYATNDNKITDVRLEDLKSDSSTGTFFELMTR